MGNGGFFGLTKTSTRALTGNAFGSGGFFGSQPIVSAGWTRQNSPTGGAPITGLATDGAGVTIATDINLNVYRSTNGTTFTLVTNLATGTPGDFGNGNYSHGVFIIGGSGSGQIFRSTDHGLTWSALIATGLGQGVAGLAGDGAGNWLATSVASGMVAVSANDGATWTAHATGTLGWAPVSVLWDGTQWVSSAAHGITGRSEIATSPDGFTLTESQIVPSTAFFNNTLAFVAGAPNLYLIPYTASGAADEIRTAATAAALATAANVPIPGMAGSSVSCILSGAGKFFAFGFNGGVADSTDAATWHNATAPLNFLSGDFCYQCVFDPVSALFIAVGGSKGSISTHT